MAEAVAIIGFAASIAQLAQIATTVVQRINEFRKAAKDVPAAFADIAIKLPLLVNDLTRSKEAAVAGELDEDERSLVLAVVEGCQAQVQELDEILKKNLIVKGDSLLKASKKAIMSIHQEEKVAVISEKLREYVVYMTHHAVVDTARKMSAPAPLKLQPVSMVPFARDSKNFIGRESELKAIEAGFETHSRLVLVGLGGIGKSQIAVEASFRMRDHSPDMWVFWVHVSSRARFKQSYADIARKVQLPRIDHPESDALQEVTDWLSDENHGQWLLILDNCDDLDVLINEQEENPRVHDDRGGKSLIEYIPQTSHGHILATSRDREVASALTNDVDCLITVESMSHDESIALLKSKVPRDKSPDKDAKDLVEELGHIPLAIKQAAAYIASPRMTITKYLQMFRKNEESQQKLLLKDFHDLTRSSDLKNSIILTWQLSFDRIRDRHPAAADLLALMSSLDRQSVPKFLLCPDDEDDMDFEDNIAVLLNFSLISETGTVGEDCFTMHRLVQLTTQRWNQTKGQLIQWREKALGLVSEAFPDVQFENWYTCGALYPHAQMLISYEWASESSKQLYADLLHSSGLYDQEQGRFELAHKKLSAAHEIRAKLLGPEHEDTTACLEKLGMVLEKEGKWAEAVSLHRETLALRQKIQGEDSIETLQSINNLGLDLTNLGKNDEAERLLKAALERAKGHIDPDHAAFLSCTHNLGEVYGNQGRFTEALELFLIAQEGRERTLGENHPDTLDTLCNSGQALGDLGRLAEAEIALRKVSKVQSIVLGPEHPKSLETLQCLASNLDRQGRPAEAEEIFRKTIHLHEKASGVNHPKTIGTVIAFGWFLTRLSRIDEALALQERSLKSALKSVGEEHNLTNQAKGGIAWCYHRSFRFEEAVKLQREILQFQEERFGADDNITLATRNNLANFVKDAGGEAESEALHRKNALLYEKSQGWTNPSTLLSWSNLATTIFERDHKQAHEVEEIQRKILAAYLKVHGQEHRESMLCRNELARTLNALGQYQEAEVLARMAYKFITEHYGSHHRETYQSSHNLAEILLSQGKYEEAKVLARKSYDGRRALIGDAVRPTQLAAELLLRILEKQGRDEEVKELKEAPSLNLVILSKSWK